MTPEQASAIARGLLTLKDEIANLRGELSRMRATLASGDARMAAEVAALTKALDALTARVDALERATTPILTAEAAQRAENAEWRKAVRSNPLVFTLVLILLGACGVLIARGDALAVLGFASRQVAPVPTVPVTEAP